MFAVRHVSRRPVICLSSQIVLKHRLPLLETAFKVPVICRSLSSPVPTPKSHLPPTDIHIHLTAAQRKQKLDLRPSPIKATKPSTLSATHTPTKATTAHPKSSDRPLASTLHVAKEVAKHDIEDAEAHGVLVPPPTGANWFQRTLHKGIELAKFYYRGIKLIYTRQKQIKMIRSRIRAGGSPLARWENRLIRTQKSDISKVIPFIFIALLLEEVIPLIAIYAPFMLPSTCILPSQRDRIKEKRIEKAISFSKDFRHIFAQLRLHEFPVGHLPLDCLKASDAPIAICGVLGLSTVGFDALRRQRIRHHLQFLVNDDRLLLQDRLLGRLSQDALEAAVQERGIVTRGLSPKHMETLLIQWLDSVGQSTSEARRLFVLVHRL